MCGKKRNRSLNNAVTMGDNSGEANSSTGAVANCVHPCTLLCHPGPCPPCEAMVTRDCDCGKQTITVRCDKAVIKCDQVCGRELSCKKHKCEKTCHRGSCGDCTETVEVNCFCGKNKATRVCSEFIEQYSCKEVCDKSLNCGNHKCEKVCHSGECAKCETSLAVIQTCPCGKFPVSVFGERLSCLDKVPTCGNICGKVLRCGPTQQRHRCQLVCHTGPCPLCPLDTQSQCRCGANTVTVKCQQIIANDGDILCTRVCKRKLHCNKHQCRRVCCVESEAQGHVCSATCNRLLSCGVHQCQENCHRGNCDRCWQFGFDDLSCHCGRSSIPAPVACGTDPPTCDFPCMRPHPCGHAPQHTCHSEEKCPPCPVLIEAPCVGGHQMMRSVPCYIGSMSCGRPCNKGLPSCDHLCTQTCHSGSCLKDNESCQQKCQVRRMGCGHACNETCHYGSGDCPPSPCKQLVPVSCVCNRVKGQLPCNEYVQRSKGSLLESAMNAMNINSDSRGQPSDGSCYTLPCKDSCKRDAWLQRLDDAFGPIGSSSLVVPYTDFLIQMGMTGGYAEFIYELEKTCFNLVQSCVDTGLRQQFPFKPMSSTKRRIIHELAEYYGLESQAYDEEPMKHVVIFGYRNRVKIPDSSLTSVIAKRIKENSKQQPAPGVISIPRSNTAGSLSSFPAPSRPPWGPPRDDTRTTGYSNQQDSDGWTVVGSAQFTQSAGSIGQPKSNNTRQINDIHQSFPLGTATNWASNFAIPGQQSSQNITAHPTSNINWPIAALESVAGPEGQISSHHQSQNSQWAHLNSQWGSQNLQINFQNVHSPSNYEPDWTHADSRGAGIMQANSFQFTHGVGEEEPEPGLVSLGPVRSMRSNATSVSSNATINNHLQAETNMNNRYMLIDHFDS
ncbi:protein shuttle craft-like isoform X2 [Convolutriloba macropyga]|uniref:protein shuttle craft-like isoform X2 n=1 Tax=Convolutriloba macropyga TaxID=536237 RepID=UPI003F520613